MGLTTPTHSSVPGTVKETSHVNFGHVCPVATKPEVNSLDSLTKSRHFVLTLWTCEEAARDIKVLSSAVDQYPPESGSAGTSASPEPGPDGLPCAFPEDIS